MDSKESYVSGLFRPSSSATCDDDNEFIRFCSARPSPPTGFSVESCSTQNFHHLQQLTKTGILMSPQPVSPPPVAMSLRARESSARDLKRIFDQQISNNASSREQRQQTEGFQAVKNHSILDLRKCNMPDLDLSFKKAQDINLSYAQKGFGSPISTPTNESLLSQASLLSMSGHMPQAAPSARNSPPSQQPTAPMTVFYAGNVNVYDDVPVNKAHAIMLLAGNSWSSSSLKCLAPPASLPPVSLPAETMMMRDMAPSPIKATPSQHASVTSTNDRGGAIAKSFGCSPGSVTAFLGSPPPSPAPQALSPVADNVKSPHVGAAAKRPHAGIELPHARKASLARFLEKRKDRVQVQQDQQGGAAFEKVGGEPTSGNDKPAHAVAATSSSSKKRSRSPSPSRGNSKEETSINNAVDEIPSANERCFFH